MRRELEWAQIVGGRVVPWPPPPGVRADLVSTAPHLALGRAAEAAAARFLERHGYQVLTTNFRAKGGELDVVAMDGTALAIVEVRYRASDRFGGAAASITFGKRRRIIRAARPFWRRTRRSPSYRLDSMSSKSPATSILSTAS